MNTPRNTIALLIIDLGLSLGLMYFLRDIIFGKVVIKSSIDIVWLFLKSLPGIFALRQFLWLINGRQELIIEDGFLTITSRGTFMLSSPKKYDLNLITHVSASKDVKEFGSIEKSMYEMQAENNLFFWYTRGEITFKYDGRKTVKVFNHMMQEEKIRLVNEINKRIPKP